ncbi:VOC family protein [Novosphingobium tardum]|uniref:VOC family protein n=1 Tax=Novosphingobium tardum TaxID=1538021 RepID=A0ABV8RSH9_9SPHN
MLGTHLPVRQLAFFVADVRAAALAHVAAFGSGPYFVADHVALASSQHRGVERPFDHSSAYGQWGSVMVEFVAQHNPDPSALRDAFPQGPVGGLHHTALFVLDLDASIAAFEEQGMPLAQLSVTQGGTAFAFIDALDRFGHMLELYEPAPLLTGFYEFIASAAEAWDGRDPLRSLG